MEEDLKILEDLLEEGFEAMCYSEAQAIEHLLKAYKELKEKLDETLNANLALVVGNANSIPISLVEEKIEEIHNLKFKDERLDGVTIDLVLYKFEELLEK